MSAGLGSRRRRVLLQAGFTAVLAAGVAAAEPADLALPRRTVIPRVETGPVLDGRLDDAGWEPGSRAASFLDLERRAATAAETTVVRLVRDREHLYAGFDCRLADGAPSPAGEAVAILLDTGLTRHDAFSFRVTADGALEDAELHRLPETERMIVSPQWNSAATAVVVRTETGWSAELRIPLADLGEKAAQSVDTEAAWGLQLVRYADAGTRLSTWSRAYQADEPKDFGTVVFSGTPVLEETRIWKQTADAGPPPAEPPRRARYPFARLFVFGPDPDDLAGPGADDDPPGAIRIYPGTRFEPDTGYGFDHAASGLLSGARMRGNGYGRNYSPLVKTFVGSRAPALFRFLLPQGRYRAIATSGGFPSAGYAPTDTRLTINGTPLTLENPMPFRAFESQTATFESDGVAPVRMAIESRPGLAWRLNHLLVYPEADEDQAAPAFESLQRDFFNHPVEETVYNRVSHWVEYPAPESVHLTDGERRAGFALFSRPTAQFTPRNDAPQAEDSRGPLRAIGSPGGLVTMQAVFHAVRPVARLEARLARPPPAGLSVELLEAKYGVRNIGRGALKQWGYQPRTLWPAGPVRALPAGRTQPFWLRVGIASNAAPGVYRGALEFVVDGQPAATREFRVVVLPFVPTNERFIWSLYYTPSLAVNGYDEFTPEEQAVVARMERTYLRDLKRHGMNRVAGGSFRESYVKEQDGRWHFRPCSREALFLDLLREEGLAQLFTPLHGIESSGAILNDAMRSQGLPPIESLSDRYRCQGVLPPAFFDNLESLVRDVRAFYRSRGDTAPAFFLWDEPGDVSSPALAPLLDAVRRAGGRTHVTLVAGCFPALEGRVDNRDYNGIAMGIPGGGIESPERLLERKNKDGTINVVYQNSTVMGADPRQARFCFGYWAWAWNLDGLNPYKYWKIHGDPLVGGAAFHPLHLDGPDRIAVSTIAWEMHAEGVYDNALVQMLEAEAAARDGSAGDEARAFLADLKAKSAVGFSAASDTMSSLTGAPIVSRDIWPACRYDRLRAELVRRLLALRGEGTPAIRAEVEAVAREAGDREAAERARRRRGLPAVRSGNLVARGDAEGLPVGNAAPEGFRWSPNASVQDDAVHGGRAAFRFARREAAANDSFRFPMIPLVPGRHYAFQAWVRRRMEGEKGSPHSGFWLHLYGPEKGAKPFSRRILVPFSSAQPSFDWRPFTAAFAAEPGEAFVEIWVYDGDPATRVEVDDVTLVEEED